MKNKNYSSKSDFSYNSYEDIKNYNKHSSSNEKLYDDKENQIQKGKYRNHNNISTAQESFDEES